MLALLLAAAIGQVNVGDYVGYGHTIYVQLEPYAYSEDEFFVIPEDFSAYDQYEFGDDDGSSDFTRGAMVGNAGVAGISINETGPGTINFDLTLVPNQAAGSLVLVSGQIVIGFYDVDDKEVSELTLPIFAIFAPPRVAWTWRSGPFTGITPGFAVTAVFTGYGLTTAGFWTCPGVASSALVH